MIYMLVSVKADIINQSLIHAKSCFVLSLPVFLSRHLTLGIQGIQGIPSVLVFQDIQEVQAHQVYPEKNTPSL